MSIRSLLFLLCVFLMSQTAHATDFDEYNPDEDLRKQVTDINQVPQAASVGSLIITRNRFSKGVQVRCSAVLIAENYLMTAAHCVFDHLRSAPVLNIEFIPQYLGKGKQKRSRVFIKEGWIHKQYAKEGHKDVLQFPSGLVSLNRKTKNSDIAILKVISPKTRQGLGKQFGYVKPIAKEQVLAKHLLSVSLLSYPGDKENGTLWHQNCELKKKAPLIVQMNCRAYGGTSGAGVFIKGSEAAKHRVIGIISTASRDGSIADAVVFSNEIINDVEHIIAARPEEVTQFEPVTFNTIDKIYLHIENRCDKDIIAQAYFQGDGNEHWGVIEHEIPIGFSAEIGAIDSRVWYSHIRGVDGRKYNIGRDILLSIGGKRYSFKKRAVPYRNGYGDILYGDHFLRVYCM
ncbi:trypsin-like peptidase domain-containing protein [Shewanella sp.]|nr:trypsin-like peptidase domain-containing protein [Shewanella sp.]